MPPLLKFPIDDLLDEAQGYDFWVELLHPEGFRSPEGHALPARQAPHTGRERAPVVSYRCREGGAVFNAFTGTVLSGIRPACSTMVMIMVMILRGFAQGVPTKHLADELGLAYSMLLQGRHRRGVTACRSPRWRAAPRSSSLRQRLTQRLTQRLSLTSCFKMPARRAQAAQPVRIPRAAGPPKKPTKKGDRNA